MDNPTIGAGSCPRATSYSLRLSVSSECNLRCAYCLPPKRTVVKPKDDTLPISELADLATWLAETLPLTTIRITGGEPTLRPGLCELVGRLTEINPRPELALTTNATRLTRLAGPLRAAGLDRINVSLDSVDAERYRDITRVGRVDRTLAGIEAARLAGLTPIKLNAVLRRSSWRRDVPELMDYAQRNGYELRFLELMRVGPQAHWCRDEFLPASTVIQWLRDLTDSFESLPWERSPARRAVVQWRERPLVVGWITPVSEPFCWQCTRLRLDSRGFLRRCLMEASPFALHHRLQETDGVSVRRELMAYLDKKALPKTMQNSTPMAQVGG